MTKEDEQGNNPATKQLTAAFRQLIEAQKTITLATASVDAKAHCSYAPFVENDQGHFFIFVSQLATHTQNLLLKFRSSK